MHILSAVLFALTLLLCGGYAGMTLFCQIGVLPTMRRLHLRTYVTAWSILDGRMERAMPPYKLTLLAVNLASSICVFVQHRTAMAVSTAISFVLSLAALVLTIAVQVPLNRLICSFPLDGDAQRLIALRKQTEINFMIRCVMAQLAFAVLCAANAVVSLA